MIETGKEERIGIRGTTAMPNPAYPKPVPHRQEKLVHIL